VTLRYWNLPYIGQLLVDEPGILAGAGPVCPVLQAMEFAETGHRREECPDLPVSLLIRLHTLRQIPCDKSMELTTSSHRSCFLCSSRDRRNEAALSQSVPTGALVKEQ